MEQPQQYETISKFDKAVSGLHGGNGLAVKPATIYHVEGLNGDSETFTIQTIRTEYKMQIKKGWETKVETRVGDFVILTFLDKEGPVRLVIPPKVIETQHHQSLILKRKDDVRRKKLRSEQMKQIMAERMAAGFVPNFRKKQ